MTQVVIDIRELASGNLSDKVQVRISATATSAERGEADRIRALVAKALAEAAKHGED